MHQSQIIMDFAKRAGFSLDSVDVSEYETIINAMLEAIEEIEHYATDMINEDRCTTAYRDPGRMASDSDDPLNAVIRWCSVKSSTECGPLAGKRFGVKDNIAIAGIPMTAGSAVFEGYVPQRDATVVQRLLEAGAEIVATLNLDALALSGGGETSSFGPVRNPFDSSRTAAGSSGGSAAALFYDNIDITLGGDQGGSIRLPASWCGVLGLKPTRGLVPYTGAMSIEPSLDTIGPMGRTVRDVAATLDVIAGPDSYDFRQAWGVPNNDGRGYLETIGRLPDSLDGVIIAVLEEGFGFEDARGGEEGVKASADAVRGAVSRLAELGATIVRASVPEHQIANKMLLPLIVGGLHSLFAGVESPYPIARRNSTDMARAFRKGVQDFGDLLPPTAKYMGILGSYLRDRHFSQHYAAAKVFSLRLAHAYTAALQSADFLVMPTTAHYAHRILDNASILERVRRGSTMRANTGQFNMSGHPALSMPAAEANSLPVGVMLVGRHFDDARLLSTARVYEEAFGWVPNWP